MLRLQIFAGAALIAGSAIVYDAYDKAANYVPVAARASNVDRKCYMEKKEGRTTYTSDVLECSMAELAVKDHPKWMGYTVKSRIVIDFTFPSPVDGKWHKGQLSMASFPDDKPIGNGATFNVRASKTDPEKYRAI